MTEASTSTLLSNLSEIIQEGDAAALISFLGALSPADVARIISRLDRELQSAMMQLIGPRDAAEVLQEVSITQAAEIVEELPVEHAATILEQMHSEDQADLLQDLPRQNAEAILQELPGPSARQVRELMRYEPNTAGGIMTSEYLAYSQETTVGSVLQDMRKQRHTYSDFNVQYAYVLTGGDHLIGVLPLRDLLFANLDSQLADVMIANPFRVHVDDTVDDLGHAFEQHRFLGMPVVDSEDRLVGVVRRAAAQEAATKQANNIFLKFSGIIGGEELRSMPLLSRSGRRLSWLSINIVLNIVAAGVIALYEDTLAQVIALAVFLPMISDMSGCSGNQAVAVSMRELTLGLVTPREASRVLFKESALGLINGLVLGVLMGVVAFLWKHNIYLSAVVGAALAINTVISVVIGGLLPLILRRLKFDPALVSSPLLTTVTDMCGFFLALSFASAMLERLTV